MSNALAVAAVTESLVNLLMNAIDAAQVTNANVSNVTPDTDQVANPGINVFLYQVTPNAAKRNADLPTRAADGSFLTKPQAALDLHYLLTFYGDDTYLEQQRLLGAAALALHATPTLPRSAIQPVQLGQGLSAPSGLDTQSELIRFTPVAFSLEELSKLWSFLLKVDYVLSAAYLASVVLIEQDETVPPPALPVLSYKFSTLPYRQPVITQIVASPNAAAPITAAGDIALIGTNLTALSGGATEVLINGAAQTPAAITSTRITMTLPAGLAAGPQTAQVLQPVVLGVPPILHSGTGVASGIAAFVLNPFIAPGNAPGSFAITVLPEGGSPPGPGIAVTIVPTVQAGQRALLYLVPQGGAAPGLLFDGGTLTTPADTVTFSTPDLPSGTYVVSVLVDGAQSPTMPGPNGPPPTITV